MDEQDLFKIIGFFVFGMFIIYYVTKCLQMQTSIIEGLTNEGADKPDTVKSTTPPTGAAGNAAKYAAAIKSLTTNIQDELLISKYRKDYENAIINLDDFVSMIMLKQALSLKASDGNSKPNIEVLASLATLKSSKDALNSIMTFIDKQ
jgi:hypothetical protein